LTSRRAQDQALAQFAWQRSPVEQAGRADDSGIDQKSEQTLVLRESGEQPG